MNRRPAINPWVVLTFVLWSTSKLSIEAGWVRLTLADFGVELVAPSEGAALFCALRKGGTQRIKISDGLYAGSPYPGW